jgi:hypothetical protein
MLLLGTKNTSSQDVLTGGLVNLGQTYRRYDKKGSCGFRAFDFSSNGISLQHIGIYHVTAVITFTGTVAGDFTFQLVEDGTPILGAIATETITTPTTEFRTVTLDYYVLVDNQCLLGKKTVPSESISIINASEETATVTNIVVNVEKVV